MRVSVQNFQIEITRYIKYLQINLSNNSRTSYLYYIKHFNISVSPPHVPGKADREEPKDIDEGHGDEEEEPRETIKERDAGR